MIKPEIKDNTNGAVGFSRCIVQHKIRDSAHLVFYVFENSKSKILDWLPSRATLRKFVVSSYRLRQYEHLILTITCFSLMIFFSLKVSLSEVSFARTCARRALRAMPSHSFFSIRFPSSFLPLPLSASSHTKIATYD
jgi:hypothetical protein